MTIPLHPSIATCIYFISAHLENVCVLHKSMYKAEKKYFFVYSQQSLKNLMSYSPLKENLRISAIDKKSPLIFKNEKNSPLILKPILSLPPYFKGAETMTYLYISQNVTHRAISEHRHPFTLLQYPVPFDTHGKNHEKCDNLPGTLVQIE